MAFASAVLCIIICLLYNIYLPLVAQFKAEVEDNAAGERWDVNKVFSR